MCFMWANSEIEIWSFIDGYSVYEVSNFGRVRTWHAGGTTKLLLKKPKIKTLCLDKDGYLRVYLYKNQKCKNIMVHTLVLTYFKCPRLNGMEASHLDGNKANNKITNLVWESHLINNKRRKEHGTWVCGKNNPLFGRKLPEEYRKKMSERMKGRYKGVENHFYGQKHTEESKKKMAISSLGKLHSEETKQKIAQSQKRRLGLL